MAVRSRALKPAQKMKTRKNDLELGLRLHVILNMKMTPNGKMQRIKVVVFCVRKISRQDSTP